MLIQTHHEPCSTPIPAELLDHFYPPTEFNTLATLVAEYEATRQRIEQVHSIITQETNFGVLRYFFEGNDPNGRGSLRHSNSVTEVFALEGALRELTATYWQKALDATGLQDIMPQKRRSEWYNTLNAWREPGYKPGANPEHDMPEFTLANLQATVESLLSRRPRFVAERVDGIFSALSRAHVTNRPEGFYKRMIIQNMFNEWGSVCWERKGYLQDLRLIIAKFMGRDEPHRDSTAAILEAAKLEPGCWIECDAGSLRIKAFKIGTLHLEVHPEMAWRLNAILAYLYPLAIPESSRQRPARRPGASFHAKPLFDRPLSNAVLAALAQMEEHFFLEPCMRSATGHRRVAEPNTLAYRPTEKPSKHLMAELETVLTALGGTHTRCSHHPHLTYWQFGYRPAEAVQEVIASGVLPDHKSHQFYPTPPALSAQLVRMAQIHESDIILEPSAGQGGIADHLPPAQTTCVEISALHCRILREKGHRVVQADFLAWEPGRQFSAIVMNPPYSEGRWQAHLRKAVSLLAPGGRLVAVLPATAVRSAQQHLEGVAIEFGAVWDNAFAGTSISVVPVKITRRATAQGKHHAAADQTEVA